jgi:hypothetical protein
VGGGQWNNVCNASYQNLGTWIGCTKGRDGK